MALSKPPLATSFPPGLYALLWIGDQCRPPELPSTATSSFGCPANRSSAGMLAASRRSRGLTSLAVPAPPPLFSTTKLPSVVGLPRTVAIILVTPVAQDFLGQVLRVGVLQPAFPGEPVDQRGVSSPELFPGLPVARVAETDEERGAGGWRLCHVAPPL